MILAISWFASLQHRIPRRETIAWLDFVALLSSPRRSPCMQEVCGRSSCLFKRGECWSPALYVGAERRLQDVEAITLLVFDVEQATDDQIDEIRGRIGGLQYLIHSTHSDRPDSRCLRVIVPLSRAISPDTWAHFWRAAQRSLVPIASSACADVCRVYFLPSCSRDGSYFIQVNEGSLLDVDAVLAAAPPSQQVPTSAACRPEGEVAS